MPRCSGRHFARRCKCYPPLNEPLTGWTLEVKYVWYVIVVSSLPLSLPWGWTPRWELPVKLRILESLYSGQLPWRYSWPSWNPASGSFIGEGCTTYLHVHSPPPPPSTHTHTRTHIHTHMHTHTCTHSHTHTYTHSHSCTLTHTQSCSRGHDNKV